MGLETRLDTSQPLGGLFGNTPLITPERPSSPSRFPLAPLTGESDLTTEKLRSDRNAARIERAKNIVRLVGGNARDCTVVIEKLEKLKNIKNRQGQEVNLNSIEKNLRRLGVQNGDKAARLFTRIETNRPVIGQVASVKLGELSQLIATRQGEQTQSAILAYDAIRDTIGPADFNTLRIDRDRAKAFTMLVLEAHIEQQTQNLKLEERLTRAIEILDRNIRNGKIEHKDAGEFVRNAFSSRPEGVIKKALETLSTSTISPEKAPTIATPTSRKEVLRKVDAKERLEGEGIEKTISREARVYKEALKSTETESPGSKRQNFQRAFEKMVLTGTYDETGIKKILTSYGLDPEKDDSMFKALLKMAHQKETEVKFILSLGTKAEVEYQTKYGSLPTEKRPDKDVFVRQFQAERLVRILMRGRKDIDEVKRRAINKGIEDGKITFSYPTLTTEERAQVGDGAGKDMINSAPTIPVLVATPEYMAMITGAETPELSPRGMYYQVRSSNKERKPAGVPKEREMIETWNDFNIIMLRAEDVDKGLFTYNGTMAHELGHLLRRANQDLIAESYTQIFSDKLFPKALEAFKSELGLQIYDNDIASLKQIYSDKLANRGKKPSLQEIATNNPTAEKFIAFITNGRGKDSMEKALSAIEKQKIWGNTVDEIIADGKDMQTTLTLREVGVDPTKDDPRARGALGLIRIYNKVYGTPDEDSSQYLKYKDYLWQQALRTYGNESQTFPLKVIRLVQKIDADTKSEAANDKEMAMGLLGRLDFKVASVIEKFENSGKHDWAEALKQVQDKTYANISKGDFVELIKKLTSLPDDPDNKRLKADMEMILDQTNGTKLKDDPKAFLAYLELMGVPPTQEEIGQNDFVFYNNGVQVRGLASGPISHYRNFFDRDPRIGNWGAPNTKYTALEAVPLIGPFAQNFLDSFNPKSRVYTHIKDPGPFREFAPLNLKIWRDNFGVFTDDALHRIDPSDPLEGFTQLFGINIFRNRVIAPKRFEMWNEEYSKKQKDENRQAVLENRRPKDVGFGGRFFIKDLYYPEGLVQPSTKAYYELVLDMMTQAFTGAGISRSETKTILSVIGGVNPNSIEPKIGDFSDPDEYRANRRFVEFLPTLKARLGKSDAWLAEKLAYMTEDSVTYKDGKTNRTEKIDIYENNGEKGYGYVKKGMITNHLLNDICESILCQKEDEGAGLKGKETAKHVRKAFGDKAKFEKLGIAMMTADRFSRSATNGQQGFTLEHLMQKLYRAENDPLLFKQRDVYNKNGKWVGYNQEAQLFMDNPTIEIRYGPGKDDVEKFSTKDAKEFIKHYFIARARTVTSLGVWGMEKRVPESEQPIPVASRPDIGPEDGRYYSFDQRRKLFNRDMPHVAYAMTAADLVDPVKPVPDELLETLNGKKDEFEDENTHEKFKFVEWPVENMIHDVVIGAVDGAVDGRKMAYMFTTKLRQAEHIRDLAKAKKDLWEGTNNVDDTIRVCILAYTIASILFPALIAINPMIPIFTLGWSFTVSPYINRLGAGYGQRELGMIEAINAFRGEMPLFYGLTEDLKYHSKGDIAMARSVFETVKYQYKKGLVDLSKHGSPDSNIISRKANSLLAKIG